MTLEFVKTAVVQISYILTKINSKTAWNKMSMQCKHADLKYSAIGYN